MGYYAVLARRLSQHLEDDSRGVFTRDELYKVIYNKATEWAAPPTLRASRLIEVTLEKENLNKIELTRQTNTGTVQTKTRYAMGDVSSFAIGQSIGKNVYLSHSSAMFLNGLTDQESNTMYVNREQSPKPKPNHSLNQPAIDRAFKGAPRTSSYVFTLGETEFVLLSGKHTERLEVGSIRTPSEETVDATKLERTLIDIVVRPVYAGGPQEVLKAYKAAASRLSIDLLLTTLRKLDYVYPYHQAIGFLLERAGVPEETLSMVEAIGIHWDFYLANEMREPQYDSRWRLFFPQGM